MLSNKVYTLEERKFTNESNKINKNLPVNLKNNKSALFNTKFAQFTLSTNFISTYSSCFDEHS